MKIKVICWNVEGKFSFDNIDGAALSFESGINHNGKSIYLHYENNTIEIVLTKDSTEEFFKEHIAKKHISTEKEVIIVDEINDANYNIIKYAAMTSYITVITGKKLLKNSKGLNKELMFNNIIYMPQLVEEKEKINIDSIFSIISNRINNKSDSNEDFLNSYILVGNKGNDEPIGNIPLYIVKRMSYFNQCKEITLNLYSDKEIDIQELTFIEDPINEYLENNVVLKIIQYIDLNYSGKVYFCAIGKK